MSMFAMNPGFVAFDEDPAVPTDTWQTYDGVTGKVHTGLTHGEAMEVFSSFAQRAA